METQVSRAIVRRFFQKLDDHLVVDVAVVGAGPSGLVAAALLAEAGRKVAMFERTLKPGGGIWGGGMLFNEIVVPSDALAVLDRFGIGHRPAGDGLHTADAVEVAGGLIFGAAKAGVKIFNAVEAEDVVFKEGRIAGLVVNFAPVRRLGMHVDPLLVAARAVLDSTGHPSEVAAMAARKAGIRLETDTGGIVGEKPAWVDQGERMTVAQTKRLYPGLYVSGMAANNTSGGFRMGPIFGGMFHSGEKVAQLILTDLEAGD
ncbi:MAG TPA: sulfide-dependent adenosine diphosphate thiazole synthase [Acidobacteriota bacterium]|nr:sulfide-dependent adenosine diphosphate thiazole synthase [Acidobacteriota bacterium]HQF88056.1 sulfide-dependent adenosine diphosphate thiazole synthase [Acidobacteriota bacterium]HQG92134.1 sulfide-dependent adenosine diphosphate thiazole synthase [Acidobacteriota bacterium]